MLYNMLFEAYPVRSTSCWHCAALVAATCMRVSEVQPQALSTQLLYPDAALGVDSMLQLRCLLVTWSFLACCSAAC